MWYTRVQICPSKGKNKGRKWNQSYQKFEKNHPIFGNVAKTVAKLQNFKLKVKNICIKPF